MGEQRCWLCLIVHAGPGANAALRCFAMSRFSTTALPTLRVDLKLLINARAYGAHGPCWPGFSHYILYLWAMRRPQPRIVAARRWDCQCPSVPNTVGFMLLLPSYVGLACQDLSNTAPLSEFVVCPCYLSLLSVPDVPSAVDAPPFDEEVGQQTALHPPCPVLVSAPVFQVCDRLHFRYSSSVSQSLCSSFRPFAIFSTKIPNIPPIVRIAHSDIQYVQPASLRHPYPNTSLPTARSASFVNSAIHFDWQIFNASQQLVRMSVAVPLRCQSLRCVSVP